MSSIDASRAAELLTEFMEHRRDTFGSSLADVVLDLRQERLVDQLCRRLAKETPAVRVLFAARIAMLQANASYDADAVLIGNAISTSGDSVLSELFRKVLADARLPRNWDRKKFGDVQPSESE